MSIKEIKKPELTYIDKVEGFEEVTIKYVPRLKGDNGTSVYGECHVLKREICISIKENKTQQELKSTLTHELFHYALHKSGWSQLLEEKDLSEEALVQMLEHFFAHLIKFK